ncbi:MAG: hypothetical protein J5855_10880 [Mailhella sp.]|nr:hypothetical protein [Mailhella sp.]
MDTVTIKTDNGKNLTFSGRLFSETSWYDEENGALTAQKLYITDKGEQVYSIVSGDGRHRERRAYRIAVHDNICTIESGGSLMALPVDMLMLAVRSLCGLRSEQAPVSVEEILRAANC